MRRFLLLGLLAPNLALAAPNARLLWLGNDAHPLPTPEQVEELDDLLDGREFTLHPAADAFQQGRRPATAAHGLPKAAMPSREEVRHLLALDNLSFAAPPDAWRSRALQYIGAAERLGFVEDLSDRTEQFELYVAIGRMAEEANEPGFFDETEDGPVNRYLARAAAMLEASPKLAVRVRHGVTRLRLNALARAFRRGELGRVQLDFTVAGVFDPKALYRSTVWVNGLRQNIPAGGIIDVPAGVLDIRIERSDGHGLSARFVPENIGENGLFRVREQAHLRARRNLVDPWSSTIDTEWAGYLDVYRDLHPDQEVFVAAFDGTSVFAQQWDAERSILTDIGAPPEPERQRALLVELQTDQHVTSAELSCVSGTYRERARFQDGIAEFFDVPDDECRLSFKGGALLSMRDVRPSEHTVCTVRPTHILCD